MPVKKLFEGDFQLFQADQDSDNFLFNFFLLKFPEGTTEEKKSEEIFKIVELCNLKVIPYNMVFLAEEYYIVPR